MFLCFFLNIFDQANFHFESADYEKQLLHMNGASNQSGLIITNPCQNVFLFVDRHHLQVDWTIDSNIGSAML